MPDRTPSPRLRRARILARGLVLVVVAVPCFDLLARWADLHTLSAWFARHVAARPVTSIGVLLLGLSIHLLKMPGPGSWQRLAALAGGAITLVLGLVTLEEGLLGWSTPVAHLLFDFSAGAHHPDPVHVSLPMALGFSLAGLALIFARERHSARASQILCLLLLGVVTLAWPATLGGDSAPATLRTLGALGIPGRLAFAVFSAALLLVQAEHGFTPLAHLLSGRDPAPRRSRPPAALAPMPPPEAPPRKTEERRTFEQGLIALTAAVALVIAISGVLHYETRRREERQGINSELVSVADMKALLISQWRHERMGDAHVIGRSPLHREAIAALLAQPDSPSLRSAMTDFFSAFLGSYSSYRGMAVFDPEGRVITSVGSPLETEDPTLHREVRAAGDSREPTFSDLHLSSSGKIHLDVLVPIQPAGSGPATKPIAIVMLQIEPDAVLYSIMQLWPGSSKSGESLLVRREGEDVVYLSRLRHGPAAPLSFRRSLQDPRLPAAIGVKGNFSPVEGVDYAGRKVFAVTRPVPDSPWFVVAKVDYDEVYAELRSQAVTVISITGLLLTGTVTIAGFIWRQNANEFTRRALEGERNRNVLARRLALLNQNANDAIFVFNTEGKVLEANQRAVEMYGYSVAEFPALPPGRILAPEASGDLERYRDQAISSEGLRLETMHQRKDGSHFPVEYSGRGFDVEGERLVLAIIRDISARKAAEQELRKLTAAVEQSPVSIMITDLTPRIEYVNAHLTTLTGFTPAELLGQSPSVFKSGQTPPETFVEMWDCLGRGQTWRGELINRKKNGDVLVEMTVITPIKNSAGAPIGYLGIKQDITEQKNLEAKFLHSQRMEAVGALAGGIAHDLNNILAPLLLLSGLLRDKVALPADRKIAETMQTEIRRGADIIRQLLTFSRGLGGTKAAVQVRHIAGDAMAMMRETFPREITLHQRFAPDLWTVQADSTQLHQVIINLCVNARDAMPDGGHLRLNAENVTLAADDPRLPAGLKPGPFVAFEVGDTGVGIPPEIRQRIFEPFFTTKPIGRGTGLGLSTVHGIVQAHHGFMVLESEVGRGSVFRIFLPATPQEAAAPAAPESTARVAGAKELILVVDDEPNIRLASRLVLESHGFRVLLAANGGEALEKFRRQQPEVKLVLLDVMMPVMNGIALAKALRELEPNLPLIVSSGMHDPKESAELQALGLGDVLVKPYSEARLLEYVRARLTGARPA